MLIGRRVMIVHQGRVTDTGVIDSVHTYQFGVKLDGGGWKYPTVAQVVFIPDPPQPGHPPKLRLIKGGKPESMP